MKFPKMNKQVKALWLKALRSGEYAQGRERLLTEEENGEHSFCCLGVLCDLYSRKTGQQWEKRLNTWDGYPVFFLGVHTMPPLEIDKWSELDSDAQDKLAGMNDKGKSFKAIAKWISRNL